MSSILILYLIFYLILAKIRLDWAVMLLIAALPSYLIRFQVLSVPFTLLEAMILISFAVWVFTNWRQLVANIRQAVAVPFGRLRRGGSKSSIENRQSKIVKYPFRWKIILLLLISYIALAISGFSDSALGIWKAYFFEPVLVFILVLNIHTKRTNVKRKERMNINGMEKILWPLAISAFVVSIFAIYQKFTGHFIFNELWAAEETRRVTSFFGYPNAVGLYLGPLSLLLIGWLAGQVKNFKNRNSKSQITNYKQIPNSKFQIPNKFKIQNSKFKIQNLFILITIILSLLSIYFAKSEGALAGVAVGLIIFGLLSGKKIKWVTMTLIFIAGLGIIMSQPMRDYAIKKITLRDLSGEIRKQQWRETWQMLTDDRIITGSGLANYQNAIKPYHQEGIFFNKDNDPDFRRKIVIFNDKYRAEHWQPVEVYLYPHNIFLNFWVELGLVGILLFVWMIGKYFIIGIKNFRKQTTDDRRQTTDDRRQKYIILGLVGAMAVIVIHGIVDVPYFKNDLAVMFWVLIGMMSIINLEERSKKINPISDI